MEKRNSKEIQGLKKEMNSYKLEEQETKREMEGKKQWFKKQLHRVPLSISKQQQKKLEKYFYSGKESDTTIGRRDQSEGREGNKIIRVFIKRNRSFIYIERRKIQKDCVRV